MQFACRDDLGNNEVNLLLSLGCDILHVSRVQPGQLHDRTGAVLNRRSTYDWRATDPPECDEAIPVFA